MNINTEKLHKALERLATHVNNCGGIEKRPPMTKLHYKRLSNKIWYNLGIFKDFEFESFSTLLDLNSDGEFIHAVSIEYFLRVLFNKFDYTTIKSTCNREQRRSIEKMQNTFAKIINHDYATVIFVKKSKHNALQAILKKIGITSKIINGDNLTNLTCESAAKCFINDEYSKNNKTDLCFLIDSMGNRSFSVKEIKNIILMIDNCAFGSLMQKIGRALTPHSKIDYCNVIDFRTKKTLESHLYTMITGYIEDKIDTGKSNISNISKNLDVEQLLIQDYFNNGIYDESPIVDLSITQIKQLIEQKNYSKKILANVVQQQFKNICDQVVNFDFSAYNNYKPDNSALQHSTFITNKTGGKKIDKEENSHSDNNHSDSEHNNISDKEKAICYHIDWFIKNYIYIFRQFCTMFDEHIILQGFNTGLINTAILESDKLLSYDICKVIINEFDKHLYDLLDSELKKSMLY